jgi:hypothetical protein
MRTVRLRPGPTVLLENPARLLYRDMPATSNHFRRGYHAPAMKLLSLLALLLPLCAVAQPAKPVIGYLGAESPERFASRVEAFKRGLADAGYVDGRNVVIEYRWARGDNAQLPALAA